MFVLCLFLCGKARDVTSICNIFSKQQTKRPATVTVRKYIKETLHV